MDVYTHVGCAWIKGFGAIAETPEQGVRRLGATAASGGG
jgi:hypothetical protein